MNLIKLRKMLDSHEISAVELTQLYLDRIKKADKLINSYITVCEEQALLSAKNAQNLIDAGNADALCGIPFSIKDNICTKDIKTTCASKMLENFIPPYDATVVERLKNKGAIILGKTNMDEFAMGASSQTSYFGDVKNPYDISKVAGGSSGGAAASVAAKMCSVSLGSDTGGSIRQPAAFCGVTGLKPTYGTVSRWGLIAFASSLDQIGICGNCAVDTGIVLDAIYGYDKNDSTLSPLAKGGYTKNIGMILKGLKIGIPKEFFSGGIDTEVRTAVLEAVSYYSSLGCEIIECSLPSLEYAVSAYYLISSAEAASNLSRFDGIRFGYRSDNGNDFNSLIKNSRREGFGKEVKRRIMLGNYALSSGYYDDYYRKAAKIRAQIIKEYNDIFEKCDIILTPTAPTTAYNIGEFENDPVKMYTGDICTVSVNIAGLPAVSTPCGYSSDGMPIGMSITGRAFDEALIIAVCDRFEKDFAKKEAALL